VIITPFFHLADGEEAASSAGLDLDAQLEQMMEGQSFGTHADCAGGGGRAGGTRSRSSSGSSLSLLTATRIHVSFAGVLQGLARWVPCHAIQCHAMVSVALSAPDALVRCAPVWPILCLLLCESCVLVFLGVALHGFVDLATP
jgi:hypothetical protein